MWQPKSLGCLQLPRGVQIADPIHQLLMKIDGRESRMTERDILVTCCCMTVKNRGNREEVFEILQRNKIECNGDHVHRDEFYARVLKSKFVVSPKGNAEECYRTWEVLALGAIPIIETSRKYFDLYSDLPVIMVRNWKSITPIFLEKEWNRITANKDQYNYQKVFHPYWLNQLASKPI